MEVIIDVKTANALYIGAKPVAFNNVNGLSIKSKCIM